MAIAGTLVTRFGYDGIRSGATIDEVVDIARYAATHETPWEDVGCTALVWAITNLAGVPINQAWNAGRAVNNNPTTPGAASEQGYAVTADLAGDGWDRTNLINRDNPYAAIAVGDILRLEAVNTSGAYGQHSMIVTRYYGSDPSQIWVVDNQNGEVTEHLLSDVIAGMNNNGGIVTFLRHRLDESYVEDNIPNGAEGWAEGRFYNIAKDLPGDASTTAVLELGTSLDGAIDFSGDSDWFKIWLVAGSSYSFAVRGTGSGKGSLEDPKIRIRTPDGVHLSDWDNDNSPQTDDGLDARITGFTASTTGYYYVTAYANGSGVGTYQISAVASTPSATANSGSTTDLGDLGDTSATTDISTDFDDASLLTVNGGAFASAIDAVSDTDYFALNLEAGKTYEILVEATAQGNVDPYIYFFNPVLGLIAQNDDGGEGTSSLITYTATVTGTYYLRVNDYATGTGGYQVTVSSPEEVVVAAPSSGNDSVFGSSGGDLISALAGNDTVRGLDGDDTLRGNGGNDRLFGDDGSDKLFGNGGRDVLSGGSDGDFLSGGGARDRLYGNSEDDRLYGNGGKDRLYGGEGDDSLYGGKGADKPKGGAGDDTFIFTEAATLRNADKILDFDGDYDRIGLCQNIYDGLPVGALSASAFASNTDGMAEDAADRIIYESDFGRLYYDADGTGSQTRQLIAILSGAPDLDASDVYIF